MYKYLLMSDELTTAEKLASANFGSWLDFQRKLVEHRIAKGLTQVEVARLLGVSQPAVSQLEKATNMPSLTSIFAYATAIEARIGFNLES